MGYHKNKIGKGKLGELSKIQEELDELVDAESQGVKILMMCELADLIGAIDHYVQKRFPYLSLKDLRKMSRLTKKAFDEGTRI